MPILQVTADFNETKTKPVSNNAMLDLVNQLLLRGDHAGAELVLKHISEPQTAKEWSERPKSERKSILKHDQKFIRRRTRFFVKYIPQLGIRGSALVLLLAAHTKHMHDKGLTGVKAAWHQNAQWFARQLGCEIRQLFNLIQTAQAAGFLDYHRTSHALGLWITKKEVFDLYAGIKENDDRKVYGYYDLRLARLLGINGCLVYSLLAAPVEAQSLCVMSPRRVAHCLPWMSAEDARFTLRQLWEKGVIQREKCDNRLREGRTGYRYRYSKRLTPDRIKWTDAYPKSAAAAVYRDPTKLARIEATRLYPQGRPTRTVKALYAPAELDLARL